MKKRILYLWSLLAAVVLMYPVSAAAQSWTASAPQDGGTYYLYNVGEGKFISGGNSWGTFMSLFPTNGISVTLEAAGTDLYKIATSPTYSGLYMGNDLYVDKAATDDFVTHPWEIKPISGMTDTYYIKETRKNRWLNVASGANICSWLSTAPTTSDTRAHWQLISRDAYIAYMRDNASATHPVDATLLIVNANFGRNASTSNWTGSPAIGGKNENMCAERWNATFDVSQTLSGLPNGVYTMDIQGFYRLGGGNNDANAAGAARAAGNETLNAIYYINSAEGQLKSIFDGEHCATNNGTYNTSVAVNINGTNYYVPNNMVRASECFDKGDYKNATLRVTVTDGTIKLGVRKTVASVNDWTIFDNIILTYYGLDMTEMVTQSLATWHSTYDAIAQQALDHSAYDAVLDEATVTAYCTNEEKLAEYGNRVWQTVCTLLKTQPTATGQYDLTSLIDNPTFETGTTGWTINGTPNHSSTNGVAEFWNQPTTSLTQTLPNMPEGTYTLKAQAFFRTSGWREAQQRYKVGTDEVKGHLILAGQQQNICNIYDQSRFQPANYDGVAGGSRQGTAPDNMKGAHEAFELGLYWNLLTATTTADANLNFGIGIDGGLDACWMPFDNFRLYYGAPAIDVNLATGMPTDDTQAANVNTGITLTAGGYNRVCLPFALDAAQTAAAFSAAYQLAGVTSDGVGQLLPVTTLEPGRAYFVTVDADKTLSVSNVTIRVARPDSIPVMWEGAATVGTYEGFTFDINFSDGYNAATFAPIDMQNLAFTVNTENWRVRRFLNEFTYDSSVASKVRAYNAGYPFPLDNPHSVLIPVPENTAALTLTVSTKSDFSEAETFTFDAGTTLCELPNLVPQNTYYYKAESAGTTIAQGQFELQGHLRMIKTDNGFNIRDLGGWETLDGRRVNYGKVFRSGELNFGHTLSTSDLAELKRLGIGAEIDWRRDDETQNSTPTLSVLSDNPDDYLYLNHDYDNMRYDYDVNKQHYKQAFEFMMNHLRNGKAVVFHCRIGADRTGLYALLLDGLCGLPFDQLCKEYELTSYSEASTREWDATGPNNLKTNLEYIQTLPGATLQQKFFYYLNTEVGIAADDLYEFVEIMVEGENSLKNTPLTLEDLSGAYLQNLDGVGASCPEGTIIVSGAKAQLSDGATTTDIDMTLSDTGVLITFPNATLEPGKEYTLTIPAGAVQKDGVENAASLSTTFMTPVAFDGIYYLYNQFADGFLSGGADWGTAARVDKYGLPIQWTVDREGIGSILYIDRNEYLYGNAWSFIDGLNNNDRPTNYYKGTVANVAGFEGVQLTHTTNTDGWIYLYVYYKPNDGANYRVASNGLLGDNCDEESQSVWQFWTKEQRDERVNNYATQNIEHVITASGIEATATTLADVLSADYDAIDRSAAVGTTSFGNGLGNWTYSETSGASGYPEYSNRNGYEYARLYEATGTFTLTVPAATVPAGLYKVELGAFERHSTEALDTQRWNDGYGNPSTSYLEVNDQQVQFTSWYQMNKNADAAGQAAVYVGQSLDQQSVFIADGYADISLYIYHDGTTDLRFTINIPTRLGAHYAVFNNLRLTQYVPLVTISENATQAPEAQANVSAKLERTLQPGIWNNFSVPFDLTADQISNSALAGATFYAYKQSDAENITFQTVTALEAGQPYLVRLPETVTDNVVNPTFPDVTIVSAEGETQGNEGSVQFVGQIYNKPLTGIADVCYLSTATGKLKRLSATGSIKGLRCYFIVPGASTANVKLIFDTPTGITEIVNTDSDQPATVFDLSGRRVATPAKGFYIVNGKKVFVK